MIADSAASLTPALHKAALAGLEALINRALRLDPATRQRLGDLADHVFLIHCTAPELKVYLLPGSDRLHLKSDCEHDAHTTLRGSATEFGQLLSAEDPANALINGRLELHGDTRALIALQQIARQLDLDWEAPLARLFGDVLGHQLGRGLRRGTRFSRDTLKYLKHQFDEYLVEESDLLPPRWQVEAFFDQVDELALRAERLEARLHRFRQQRSGAAPSRPTRKTP